MIHRALCAAERYSCQCRGGCPVHYSVKIRQLSVARCIRILPLVRRHEQVGFQTVVTASSWLQRSRVVRNTWGATPTVQGQFPKICRVLVNVFFVSVFLGLNIQSQFFCMGIQSLKASVITRGYVLSGVSEMCIHLSPCAKYTPFNQAIASRALPA